MQHEEPQYNIQELAAKWVDGTLTPEERAFYEKWYQGFDDSETQFEKPGTVTSDQLGDHIYAKLQERLVIDRQLPKRSARPFKWLAAAASIIMVMSVAGYYIFNKQNAPVAPYLVNDIAPGLNKTMLHLGNGQRIALPDTKTGRLAQAGKLNVIKTTDGGIIYQPSDDAELAAVYDTLIVPRGGVSKNGIYHLTLADGSRIWLNAATAVRYPETFSHKRTVQLLYGEAYFEVAHNASKPFEVLSQGQRIEDIGTHFNVNAYTDEKETATTLLEGAVRLSTAVSAQLLRPGQKATVGRDNSTIELKNADGDTDIAWKQGYFRFRYEKIESIMRKLSRWYDIDVQYQGPVTNERFYAKISRFKNISSVLKMLEDSKGVHFKVDGRRVTVMQ